MGSQKLEEKRGKKEKKDTYRLKMGRSETARSQCWMQINAEVSGLTGQHFSTSVKADVCLGELSRISHTRWGGGLKQREFVGRGPLL